VGTDPKMARNAAREVDPGVFAGSLLPPPTPLTAIGERFSNPATATNVLAASVTGSLLDEAFLPLPLTPEKLQQSGVWRAFRKDLEDAGNQLDDLLLNPFAINVRIRGLLDNLYKAPAPAGAAYESRVLNGIWATAPYLHNGSVPSLWELLLPARERTTSFQVGSRLFDPKNVGFATDRSPFARGTFLVNPTNGNGNGGHEYGTALTVDERWAIIEYLKTL
jgi:hypothetical protein